MWLNSATTPPPLVVVSSGASLLGLNWIQAFQLDINALHYTPKASAELLSADVHTVGVPTDLDLKKMIADHPSIFAPGLGLCTKAHLQPRDSVQPKFSKARPVPFSRINAVEKELQRLEDLNPWDRVHVNFAGPFLGSMWLLATDAHSKWPSVIRLANYPTTEITIAGLDALFTIWGLPKTLVSDNGPQFASADFANWCRSNGIVHMTSAPFHPSSNGEAMQRSVFIRNYGVNRRVKWIPGRITSSVGIRMFNVQCADGPIVVMSIRCATGSKSCPRIRSHQSTSSAFRWLRDRLHQHRIHQDARRRQGTSNSMFPMSHHQCFVAAHAIAIRRARIHHNSKLWERNVVYSFRLNIVADILSRVTLCRKFAWLRYINRLFRFACVSILTCNKLVPHNNYNCLNRC